MSFTIFLSFAKLLISQNRTDTYLIQLFQQRLNGLTALKISNLTNQKINNFTISKMSDLINQQMVDFKISKMNDLTIQQFYDFTNLNTFFPIVANKTAANPKTIPNPN